MRDGSNANSNINIGTYDLTTTGDLTIGTDVFTVDSTNGRVGINIAPTSTRGINFLGKEGASGHIGEGIEITSGEGGAHTTDLLKLMVGFLLCQVEKVLR